MKQTNNAIKFLMAQYRAIFKNANIAMVSAMVASALAAGQAQAATPADLDNAALNAAEDGAQLTVDGAGTEANTYKNLTISGGATTGAEFGKSFTITVAGGDAHTLEGDQVNDGVITAASGSLVINGKDVDGTVVSVGNSSGSAVTLGSLEVAKGTLKISKGGVSYNASVDANTIVLGTKPAQETPQTKAGEVAKIVIGKGGQLGGAKATTIDAYTGSAITIDGAQNTSAVLKATNINFKGGTLTVKENQGVTLDGAVSVDAASATTISNSGTITLNKDATFGKSSIKQGANGIIAIGGAEHNVDTALNFDSADWNGVFTGKVQATFKDNSSAPDPKPAVKKLTLNFAGDSAVDLTKVLTAADGTITDEKIKAESGTFTVNAAKATFAQGEKYAVTAGNFVLGSLDTGKVTSDAGAFAVDAGELTINDKLTIASGTKSTTLTISGASASNATLTLDGLNMKAADEGALDVNAKIHLNGETNAKNATLNVKNGTWDIGELHIQKGTVNVENATLNLNGKLTTTATTGLLNANASVVDATKVGKDGLALSGTVALSNGSTLVLQDSNVFTVDKAQDSLTVTPTAYTKDIVTAAGNSKIHFKDANGKDITLSKKQYQALLSGTGFKGLFVGLNVEGAAVEGEQAFGDKGIMSGMSGQADNAIGTTDTEVSGGSFDVGAAKVSGESLTLGTGGNLSLVNAGINGGNFVSGKSGDKVVEADVVLADDNGNGLTLGGAGIIGSITVKNTAGAGKSSVTFGEAADSANEANIGQVTVKGTVGETGKELGSVIVNGSTVIVESGDVYAHNVDLNGGSLKLDSKKSLVIGSGSAALASELNGDVTAGTLTILGSSGSLSLSEGANVSVSTFKGDKEVLVQVGAETVANGTASLFANSMDLNQGTLFVDPEYGQKFASVVVNEFKKDTNAQTDDKSAGVVNGKITVGKNAAVGVGFASKAELEAVLANYVNASGSFYEDATKGLTNALVLNKQITLDKTKDGITVDPSAQTATAKSGEVVIKAGAGLVITDNVYTVNASGEKQGSAITFTGNTGNASVNVDGSKLVLIGDFSGADKAFQVFEGATVSGSMKIESANGLLTGTLDSSNGTVGLDFDRGEAEKKGAFSDASAPVRELLFGKLSGDVKGKGLGFDLLSDVATGSLSGVVADAAAHAATYAGAQQAAVVSVTTMADAMFGRVGAVGVEAASIAATGSQANGGVWLTPMYKSMDADGFNAEGVSYGSDVDAAGVAFGADTVNGNMRFGAVFNIGSGDAEGKGNGNGLKDEFDYYGFGIYSAMGFGNFALVGDASMTVVSHDVEGLGLKGKADTTAVTMGVTGQYTVATPAVDVTPHLGARFIRLNTDSYDLVGAKGVVATTDFDVQNVFSVPLGVTLSKGFAAGGWTLAPSADLTVTFNTGDTEAKSTTTFTGSPAIGLNTEVLDEVQYGVTLGLGAQYGAFGTSFGINYTGSSNTDSFGVNAQCRYMF